MVEKREPDWTPEELRQLASLPSGVRLSGSDLEVYKSIWAKRHPGIPAPRDVVLYDKFE